MELQNFNNHTRMIPMYHYFVFSLELLLFIGAIVNLVNSSGKNLYSASLLVLAAFILFFITFYARYFALKAQDRAIKAEENFRHYLLAGKPMDSNLRMRQIIGLRFASDEEYLALAEKAVNDNLTEKEIKESIINWKADFYRV